MCTTDSASTPAPVPGLMLLSLAFLLAPSPAITQQPPAEATRRAPAVLVTGASSGIGLRTTELLSQNGFHVYAGARDPADLERLDAMTNVTSVRLDVTVPAEIDAAADRIRREGRGLFGLINNAGVAVMGPLIETSEADLAFQLDVNLLGPYRVTRAVADLLIESGGRILNVSSIAGIVSGPFNGAYSMSKHGIEAYTDALSAELARFGITVGAVEPGNYKSQIVASMVERMERTGYSAEGSRYGSMRDLIAGPLDRSQYPEPNAVAEAALHFFTSPAPKHRYMVVPNQGEAELTIRQALLELVQLNEAHPFSYTRDELVQMLDDATGSMRPAAPAPAPADDIHGAVVAGDLEAVQRYIEGGGDLDAKDASGGSSPLILAAVFGRPRIARALIGAGADVDQQNSDGSTALLTAALLCRSEIVDALLEAGADRTIRNANGSTPLDVVSVPFEAVVPIYDFLGAALGPYGLELDYDRLREARPRIAERLR
ncbi:MAG: SDR family NAD(P)-dependent oxidoreductase [Gemmatimonadota bacterium]